MVVVIARHNTMLHTNMAGSGGNASGGGTSASTNELTSCAVADCGSCKTQLMIITTAPIDQAPIPLNATSASVPGYAGRSFTPLLRPSVP